MEEHERERVWYIGMLVVSIVFSVVTISYGTVGFVIHGGYQLLDATINITATMNDYLLGSVTYVTPDSRTNTVAFGSVVTTKPPPSLGERASKVWWSPESTQLCITEYPNAYISYTNSLQIGGPMVYQCNASMFPYIFALVIGAVFLLICGRVIYWIIHHPVVENGYQLNLCSQPIKLVPDEPLVVRTE